MLWKPAAARCAAAAALVALAACARPAARREPGVIQVDIEASPIATDPRFATDAISSRVNELIFDSLAAVGRDGQLAGRLAESIERPIPTQIVFHLRRGVRFSDGREVTARDVKFTFDSMLRPEAGSLKRAGFKELKSVEAPDGYTVVMTTDGPYAPASEYAIQGIVPAGTPLPGGQLAPAPPGAGPYRMTALVRDESIVLERNPYAPDAPGAPRKIVFKIVPDPTVQALELAEGACDLSENFVSPDVLAYLGANRDLSVSQSPGTTYQYLAFNFRDPRLRDLRVRRAIAHAIDRKAIVDSMLRGTARVATGMLAPENWAYNGDVTIFQYDPAKARRLLDEAGYPAAPGGMRQLRFVYKTTPEGSRLAQAIQAMLKSVGVQIDIRSNEWATFYADIQNGNFDLMSSRWIGISDPDVFMKFDSKDVPAHGENRGAYSNPEMDRLVEAGAVTLDPLERKKIYARVQELAAQDLPYVSLWWMDTVVVMNRELAGFTPYPNGSLRSLATLTLAAPGGEEPAS